MIGQADTIQEVANLPLGQPASSKQTGFALPNLSAEDMGDWLVRHRPHDVVGTSQNPHACPISNYVRTRIKEQGPTPGRPKAGSDVCVAMGRVMVGRAKVLELSPWAKEFVADVDEWVRPPWEHGITATHALEVLERSTRYYDV